MATQSGEEIAATLFADVHYFYGQPTETPPHHRFDKGSYVYLYENARQRRARLEIANHAGTPDQDAFDGFLDNTLIEYSYKHSTLVTITVDAVGGSRQASNDHEFRLPTFDPRNEKKYLYKLHTIDIYFWEKEDALLFLDAVKNILPQGQLGILDEPVPVSPPAHREEMSPVVQQLENIAISDPSYQQGRTRDSRPSAPSFPGPPVSAAQEPQVKHAEPAPLAYNPAAPPAPEAIRHREKTPPPEDGAANPLAAAAKSDQGQSFVPPGYNQFAPPSALTFFPGPPQAGQANSPYAQPPPGLSRTTSFPHNSQAPGYNSGYPTSPGFASPMQSPGLSAPPQYNPGLPGPPVAPPAAMHGGSAYSSYQYTQGQAPVSGNEYDIHHQVYRPTEGEAAIKNKPAKAPTGKLEDSAVKLEKGVSSFLKKLEKRYG